MSKPFLNRGSAMSPNKKAGACPCCHEEAGEKDRFLPPEVYAGAILFAGGIIVSRCFSLPHRLELFLFLASFLLLGFRVILRALGNLTRGSVFDENFLMAIASIGAFFIGEYPEGAAVMLFYQVGEAFQDRALRRSRRSISALLDIRPDTALVQREGAFLRVSPEEVQVGELVLVKPGEKVPLDGVAAEGLTSLDTKALTGEALPRDVEPGDEVLSGTINLRSPLLIRVTKPSGESTVSKILNLVQNAAEKKTRVENFITTFARYYTPGVVLAALALALLPPLLGFGDSSLWIHRALVFLVVSCPCALVISVPLSFFAGLGAASAQGILVKGSGCLEALAQVDTVVFDKTGTLTQGVFRVKEVLPRSGWTREELLFYAAHAEAYSSHPIAVSIREAAGPVIDQSLISGSEERPGRGIKVQVRGRAILAGNRKLLEEEGIPCPVQDAPGTVLYVACDGEPAGCILIADEIRRDSPEAIRGLRSLGVKTIAMLTGDTPRAGEAAARELGLDRVYGGLLPQEKVLILEELAREKGGRGKIVFTGDGINDAPVLARSDIGIAMGGAGSDAAIEAADVVLMTDEPSKLVQVLQIARRTGGIVRQNIVFALGVKGTILVLGALGISGIWTAVFGDVGVAFLAILNSLRALGNREE